MRELLEMFLCFFRIGLFTFGGGYAMISVIEDACVDKKQWITHDEMMNITVIAESTPGPISINCATYVGYKRRGFSGAAVTTLGVILPSFIIIYLISLLLDNFLAIKWVASAFAGIRLAVGLLILDAAVRMIKKMGKQPAAFAILALSVAAMLCIELFSLSFSSITLVLLTAVAALAVCFVKARREKEDKKA